MKSRILAVSQRAEVMVMWRIAWCSAIPNQDLDQVMPGARRRVEVDTDSGVVVHDQVPRHVGIGRGVEEDQELLAAAPVLAQPCDLTGRDLESDRVAVP